MQHEITKPQRLLDSNGNIAEPGLQKDCYGNTAVMILKHLKSALRNGIIIT